VVEERKESHLSLSTQRLRYAVSSVGRGLESNEANTDFLDDGKLEGICCPGCRGLESKEANTDFPDHGKL
jgi:hypothetical protein